MPRLSIIMIVRDEGARLPCCLGSVRGIANEIVVVDTGSRDDTIAVARRFGAKVSEMAWENDFARARNRSIAEASGDWLLHLDADEMLDPEGAARLRQIVDADGDGADAVELVLANYCDDPRAWRWTPVAPDHPYARGKAGYLRVGLLRLFRAGMGFAYREAIHENITESVIERGGRIRREDIFIHHYGYDLDETRSGEKARLYLDWTREKARIHPDNPKALHDFAEQALACGLPEEAETACRTALARRPMHLESALTLANILLNRGDLAEARGWLEGIEKTEHAPPHALMALGAVAYHEGNIAEARHRLEGVLQQHPDNIMALLYLARVQDCLGQPEQARAYLEQARIHAPGLEETLSRFEAHTRRQEGESLFLKTDYPAALSMLVDALRLDPLDPLIHNALGVVLHALDQKAQARSSFERALQLAPGLPEALENLRQV